MHRNIDPQALRSLPVTLGLPGFVVVVVVVVVIMVLSGWRD